MNHSRQYQTIWTSSPACSEHVYLRFRVSTLRHCAWFPSLSLSFSRSFPLVSSSMHRYHGSAAPLSGALNGTFVDPSRSGGDDGGPSHLDPSCELFREEGESAERDGTGTTDGEASRKRSGERRRRKEGRGARSFVRAAGRRLASRRFSAGRRFFETRLSRAGESRTWKTPFLAPHFLLSSSSSSSSSSATAASRSFSVSAFNPPSPGPRITASLSRARASGSSLSHSPFRSRVAISSENTSAASRRIGAPTRCYESQFAGVRPRRCSLSAAGV